LVAGQIAGAVAGALNGATHGPLAILNSGAGSSTGKVPFAADLVFGGSPDFVLASFLNSVNIFTVWYIILLTIGICTLYGIGVWKAAATAGGLWLVVAAFNAIVLTTLRDAFQFQL
jgi:hypothetical protein